MDIMVVGLLFFFIVIGLLLVTLHSTPSVDKVNKEYTFVCPPGFSPTLMYKEKYGETGIAYDDRQKAIYIVAPETQPSQTFWYQSILATAAFEDDCLIAKSVRTDETGKQLLARILSEEIKTRFQDKAESAEGENRGPSRGTSSSIELRILVNNPEFPVYHINFLNMEAKKGGVIYNDAMRYIQNWQDLLSYLIRLARKPAPLSDQAIPASGQQPPRQPAAAGTP